MKFQEDGVYFDVDCNGSFDLVYLVIELMGFEMSYIFSNDSLLFQNVVHFVGFIGFKMIDYEIRVIDESFFFCLGSVPFPP